MNLQQKFFPYCCLDFWPKTCLLLLEFPLLMLLLHNVEKQEIYSRWKNISWNLIFSNFFRNNVAFTKFLSKKCECESKFSYFTHCVLTTPLTIMKPQILLRKQWHSWACYFSRKFLFLLYFEWLKTRLCFCGPRRLRGRLSSKLSRKNLRVRHFYLSLKFFVGQGYQLNFLRNISLYLKK